MGKPGASWAGHALLTRQDSQGQCCRATDHKHEAIKPLHQSEGAAVAVRVATAKAYSAELSKTDTIARHIAVALHHTTRQAIQSPT
jgi:hypothetical protein